MSLAAWLTVLHAARGAAWHKLFFATQPATPEALLGRRDAELAAAGIDAEGIARLRRPPQEALARAQRWLEQPGHRLVTWGSAEYPPRLATTDHPPLALWAAGARHDLVKSPQIAIVGSRNASRGGRETARRFGAFFGRAGLTVTSGLAAGIDAAGHEGALETGSGTIAVLGTGIDIVYPREHRALAARIAADGLLVSEYPPGVPPQPHHFPERNRIIAGLALGTLVVEAGRRSGALITARRANECGREVFAVPGSIHNPLSRGCHKLIRQGATLVEEGADVLIELAPQLELDLAAADAAAEAPPASRLLDDPGYRNLLNCIDLEPIDFGRLLARCGLTTAELSSMLLLLELDGLVEALPGGRYCRVETRSR